jgi:hypothetical protein
LLGCGSLKFQVRKSVGSCGLDDDHAADGNFACCFTLGAFQHLACHCCTHHRDGIGASGEEKQRSACMEQLAWNSLHGTACMEQLAWNSLHGTACMEQLAWNSLHGSMEFRVPTEPPKGPPKGTPKSTVVRQFCSYKH